MTRLRISATLRVAIGLAFVSTTLLLVAYSLGMIPDIDREKLRSRLAQCETIAISASVQARQDETYRMEQVLRAIAERNDDIQSVAIRRHNGFLVAEIGDHQQHWNREDARHGSNTYVVVPVLASNHEPWGSIEIRFRELTRTGLNRLIRDPCFQLFLAFPAAMVLLTFLYLRKMLSHTDPSKAVPSRVRSALDTLTGGLLVLDAKGKIVLANRAFVRASGLEPKELSGMVVSNLPWVSADPALPHAEYDWLKAIREGQPQPSFMLALDGETPRTFLVNCAPIQGDEGYYRGVLASFEDVTALKEKELELKRMLEELTHSREEIRRHNEQLRELAMRDPLTGCLNRRAFFERFEQEWSRSTRHGHPLSCIILDLDYFKSINDQYGHATGDRILKKIGTLLSDTVRGGDFVCRYGGEEFCIVLSEIDYHEAVATADRLRKEISDNITIENRPVTASIGVSSMSLGGEHPQAVVEQADKALYVAKHLGRDQVACFADVSDDLEIDESQISRIKPAEQDADVAIPFHAVTALISALGYRDAATADHSRRVADLCVAVGNRLMSVSECYILEIAALLHDIGKIGVPDSVLLKPGPLTRDEWEIMGIHDTMGVEIVDSAFNSPTLTSIIESHHAFYGGKGRHEDLPTGKDIPMGARILSIADTYDAIISDRVYRKGRTAEEAFAELRRCAGDQFDPDIVEHFIETVQSLGSDLEDAGVDVNKKTALRIGLQIERLSQAIDNKDSESLQALLGRLKMTAQAGDVHDIATSVSSLESAVGSDAEMSEILGLTNELLNLCRSTQRVFLDRQEDKKTRLESINVSET